MLVLIAVLSGTIHLAAAQVPFLGPCPQVTTVKDFNFTRYLGKWFEAERYFSLMEFAGKCVVANISDSSAENSTQLTVVTDQTSWLTEIHSSMRGQLRPVDQRSDVSKMYMRYLPMDLTVNHWVLDTDYDNYAVVFSCVDIIGSVLSTRNAWILTRARNPTLEVMEKAYSVIDKNNISRAYFIRVDHSDRSCPEYGGTDEQQTPAPATSAA
ncbi:apolipoprotein D-like [Homalodisca vitripennis]|uniref:apolipoprotein D-like n=1 Tax=Homalodisca vitripennis TaxID=197043 RepID=UPI001EEA79F6|nr:apolipoprotein D-like [Homalodisca vitripennis]